MSKFLSSLRRLRRMGCEQSTPDNHENNPMIFKGKSLNEKKKSVEWITLEVSDVQIFVRGRNRKLIAKWPIGGLQRYGYTNNIFLLETGVNCVGGKAVFLFKIERAQELFTVLKKYWNEAEMKRRNLLTNNPHLMSRLPLLTTDPASNINFNNGTMMSSPSNQYVESMMADPSYVNDEVIPRCSFNPSRIAALGANYIRPQQAELDYETAEPATTSSVALMTSSSSSAANQQQVFALQPAPVSRGEMMERRHQLSKMVAVYDSDRQSVSLQLEEAHYENVRYEASSQQVELGKELLRNRSLKSDTGPLLTPASNNTSGVGSMTSGSTSLPVRNKQANPTTDPWRYRMAALGLRTSPLGTNHPPPPHSARDYVNTSNPLSGASGGGTPLLPPATAASSSFKHFSFDFVNRSAPLSRNNSSKLNYASVDPSRSKDGLSCGAASSSTSSGIAGTPRSAKTPDRSHPATEYAIIDHGKTQALSKAQKKRRIETDARHESVES